MLHNLMQRAHLLEEKKNLFANITKPVNTVTSHRSHGVTGAETPVDTPTEVVVSAAHLKGITMMWGHKVNNKCSRFARTPVKMAIESL